MRVGILTSGGDCQGLNAALRAVAKSLYEAAEKNGEDIKIIGFSDGYKGLIYGEYSRMNRADFSGILTIGGTILGTSRQPFKEIRVIDEETGVDKVRKMKENYARLNLDCLVILGGNGSQKTANLLREEGLNIVSLAKTIDNDIYGTDISFGFQSACDIATNVIDCIHSTAYSHKRIFIVEIMGHKAGWLSLYAGIAGGADVILIPEIPYDLSKIIEVIKKRHQTGKKTSARLCAPNTLRSRTKSRRNCKTRPATKYASPSRGISSAAARPAPMTACFAPASERRQPSLF